MGKSRAFRFDVEAFLLKFERFQPDFCGCFRRFEAILNSGEAFSFDFGAFLWFATMNAVDGRLMPAA